jgi:mannose-6-phosphate isomerase-like protein (cupin superfamily)
MKLTMTSQKSIVRNWMDIDPILLVDGVTSWPLLSHEETITKRIQVKLIKIQPEKIYKPENFRGETYYYFLAGNGIILWNRDNTDLPYLVDNDTAGWIPGTHNYQFENTGEGPMRILSVSCKTKKEYVMRDGSLGKLDTITPVGRKVGDSFYSPRVGGMKVISVGGYQVFAPSKAQGLHWHNEEVIYLVRGKGTLHSGGEEHQIKAGCIAYNPRNIKHRLTNTGHDMFGYLVFEFREEL